MEKAIIKLEEELRLAMLNSDVNKLDDLIDDKLQFMIPNGNIITKQMDLEAHKTKTQIITKLMPSEQTVEIYENTAIVTVKMDIEGTYNNISISGQYRYLRVWTLINKKWKIIAGTFSPINE